MKPFLSVTGILILVVGMVVVWNITKKSSEKQMRVNEEYGNKHLMTKSDLKKYRAQFMETDNYNQIYAKDMALSLNNKRVNRSANVLVIGGTGTGKTFKYINPNILQENSTQIITDPSGDLFNKFAPFLLNKGYNVFLFNVNDFNISSYYNPLLNVFDAFGNISEVKVDVLVDLYMKNAKAGKEAGGGDPFWDKAEKAFLTAVIYYVLENDDIPKEDKCFHTVLEKVQRAKAENQGGKSAGETMLTKEINAWKTKVERQNKKIKTPIYYDTFLIAPEKTANTILITTAVDLQIFATEEVNRVTRFKGEYENTNMYINFDDMAQTQSYLFLGIPQSHQAYNFLISMLYSQMYARLYELGERVLQGKYCLGYRPEIPQFNVFDSKEEMMEFVDNVTEDNIIERDYINSTKIYYIAYKGKIYKRSVNRDVLVKLINDLPKMVYKCNNNYPELPIHVNFLLDEFKNIGEIPNFLTILSTSRKYRIGSHIILQDIAQAQTIYKDNEYKTLLANVDTTIFLGSILQEDKEEIQKMLGKTTIKIRNQSTGQGSTPNYSYNATQVDLVTISDLEAINQNGRDDCVVMVRDVPPYIGRKAYLTEHPKYNEFKNASKNLHFDLTRYYNNAVDIYNS
jgi:type IV secretory pathway TraG/TraD family ATPase VirD4